jgi:hypothetical protein
MSAAACRTLKVVTCALLSVTAQTLGAAQTSIVILPTASNIVVAADSKAIGPDGSALPPVCKIRKHDGFYYTLAGSPGIPGERYSVADTVAKASKGNVDLAGINAAFGRLILKPVQEETVRNYTRGPTDLS